MDGNCHFIFGASLGSALAMNLDKITISFSQITNTSETLTLFILGGLIGGIFPDIDNPKSHMGKLSIPISSIIGKISESCGKKGVHHRGILHDPVVYIMGLVFSYLFFPPLIGFFIGCLSHLYLDMFNPVGIPFMFNTIRIHMGKLKSGSKESIIFTWINVFLVVGIGLFFCLEEYL